MPDRLTGLSGWKELQGLGTRQWNFVEVNVTKAELEQQQPSVRAVITPSGSVMDDSIGCAIWFAARAVGVQTVDANDANDAKGGAGLDGDGNGDGEGDSDSDGDGGTGAVAVADASTDASSHVGSRVPTGSAGSGSATAANRSAGCSASNDCAAPSSAAEGILTSAASDVIDELITSSNIEHQRLEAGDDAVHPAPLHCGNGGGDDVVGEGSVEETDAAREAGSELQSRLSSAEAESVRLLREVAQLIKRGNQYEAQAATLLHRFKFQNKSVVKCTPVQHYTQVQSAASMLHSFSFFRN